MESFFTAASKRSCQHVENVVNKREVLGGWGDKNIGWGVGLIKMECPILFSAPLLFTLQLHLKRTTKGRH